MTTYEDRLDSDLIWALREGSMHFEKDNAVHKALEKITRRLDELKILYVLVGSMAMFFHGYRRFTDGVELLVTPEGLKEVHRCLEGLGYIPPFAGSKHLRDAELGVKVEFLVTGDFPGEGKPKAIAFPDPSVDFVEIEGMRCLPLPRLVELKLASGMTNPGRIKDLADVQEMIEKLGLSQEFVDQLHPFVRDKYGELWQAKHDDAAEV